MKRTLLVGGLLILVLAAVSVRPDLPLDQLEQDYGQPPSQFIEIDGMRVHYRDQGQGPAVVLLHGMFASLHTWQAWTDQLQDEYRVISLDMPGFGLTGPRPSKDYRLSTDVAFLDEFLNELDVEMTYLGGNSLGGHVAWRYALEHPDRVRGLILVDSGGARTEWSEPPLVIRALLMPGLRQAAPLILPRAIVRSTLRDVYAVDSRITPEMVDRYHDLIRRPGNRSAYIDRFDSYEPSRFDKLRSLEIPTLLIWGAHDNWIPVEIGQRFDATLPRSKLVVVEGSGHAPMEEQPQVSLAPVRAFLDGGLEAVEASQAQ